MNLLPIVLAFLLMMAALSFSELYLLRTRGKARQETLCLLDSRIESVINKGQEEKYDDHSIQKEWSRGIKKKRVQADTKINLSLFLQRKGATKRIEKENPTADITIRLIESLYRGKPFYEEGKKEYPDLANTIFWTLVNKLGELEDEGKKFSKAEEIANVRLDDPHLEAIFAQMLSDAPTFDACNQAKSKEETILSYIQFSSSSDVSLRLWLARERLLLAIYKDPEVVKELVTQRKKLYQRIRNKENEDASAAFEQLFKRELPPDMPLELFNFEVSSTAPPKN